ncbi:MAG: hypothetical protein CMJ59_15595 [Planctomycetaceae bacterium]|nr:hypothetical protein [Planctomycetaceae bacterium]
MESSTEHKQYAATPARRQQAREQGHRPHSQHLAAAAILVAATTLLLTLGEPLLRRFREFTRRQLSSGQDLPIESDLSAELLRITAFYLLPVLLPLLGVVFLVSLLVHAGQVGLTPRPHRVNPDFSRIDPGQGIERLLSLGNLLRFGSGLSQALVTLVAAWACVWMVRDFTVPLAGREPDAIAAWIGGQLLRATLKIGLALLGMAGVDYLIQRWRFERELRMTPHEVREEASRDGANPQLKHRRQLLSLQRAWDLKRQPDPAQVQVVLTHQAGMVVALGFPEQPRAAPQVLQKETGRRGHQIRRAAHKSDIPVVEHSALTQYLLQHVPAGMAVPVEKSRQITELLRRR